VRASIHNNGAHRILLVSRPGHTIWYPSLQPLNTASDIKNKNTCLKLDREARLFFKDMHGDTSEYVSEFKVRFEKMKSAEEQKHYNASKFYIPLIHFLKTEAFSWLTINSSYTGRDISTLILLFSMLLNFVM
jgi:hypothetical protein